MNTVISQSHGGTYGGQGMYDDDLQHELVKEEIHHKEEYAKVKQVISPVLFAGLAPRDTLKFRMVRSGKFMDYIITIVCETFKITVDQFKSSVRKRELVEARTIAVGLILDTYPGITLKRLGSMFGGRDHSTMIYNRQLFANLYGRDKEFTKKVDLVKQNL